MKRVKPFLARGQKLKGRLVCCDSLTGGEYQFNFTSPYINGLLQADEAG
ncbi:MAG TPA: hypothetical protein VFP47_06995 [Pyrinomonadaceae bacterium]|nr:hypothetical protein [Pyrinomonadaceae bacterium]